MESTGAVGFGASTKDSRTAEYCSAENFLKSCDLCRTSSCMPRCMVCEPGGRHVVLHLHGLAYNPQVSTTSHPQVSGWELCNLGVGHGVLNQVLLHGGKSGQSALQSLGHASWLAAGMVPSFVPPTRLFPGSAGPRV